MSRSTRAWIIGVLVAVAIVFVVIVTQDSSRRTDRPLSRNETGTSDATSSRRPSVSMRAKAESGWTGDLTASDPARIYASEFLAAGSEEHDLRQLERWETTGAQDHPHFARICERLGRGYLAQGRYDDAEAMLLRALEVRNKVLLPEHHDIARSLNHLASLYIMRGWYMAARPLLERAIEIWGDSTGPAHPEVADSLDKLASVERSEGRYTEAIRHYGEALEIMETSIGVGDLKVALTLNGLAAVERSAGRLAASEEHYQQALEIIEAASESSARREGRARAWLRAAAEFFGVTRWVGDPAGHHAAAPVHNNLGLLYATSDREAKALASFLRALAIYEEHLRSDHPLIGSILNNLGTLYARQGRFEIAEEFLERAVTIANAGLRPGHPESVLIAQNLVGLHRVRERDERAESPARSLRQGALAHPDSSGTTWIGETGLLMSEKLEP